MPSVADVRKAKVAMSKRRADYEYFFSQLTSPEWIAPLLEEGFLKDPPKPELADEGRSVRFRFWPESQYLVRMADKAPQIVVDTVAKLETDNPRVQEDVVEIALRVSPQLAVKLVPKVSLWIRDPNSRWITKKFSRLVRHLAVGGGQDSALLLAKEILWFDPDPKLEEKRSERTESESIFPITPEPEARTEEWEYGQTLEHAIPAIAELDAPRTVDLLCSTLDHQIALSYFKEDTHRPFDGSLYWRPAIESPNWHQTHRDLLVDAIRDVGERYLGKPSASFNAIEAPLLAYNWQIFTRIWLYLVRKFPVLAGERISRALTDRSSFASHELANEYFSLIQERFTSLREEQQNQILGWIEAGPDDDLIKVYSEDWDGNPVGADVVERRVRAWKVKRLQPIKEFLPTSWRELYDRLVREVGEPEPSGFGTFRGEAEWGPKSPKSEEELFALDSESIIKFLASWEPQKGWMDPSPEGLGRAFQAVVKRKPNDLAAVAGRFEELDPTYVRALISGLSDAVTGGAQIPWKPVLNLCQWVIQQPVEIPGRTATEFGEGDPNWGWTRKSIARLLREGCERPAAEITFEHRVLVWELISALMKDPDPSVEYEENHAGSMRPLTLSINTTRGEAMHAVMAYASWTHRHLPKDGRNLAAMPEAESLLREHLEVDVERTQTIRSVYGQNLLRLISIDREWVIQHEDRIFPPQAEHRKYWDIAWSSYVIFTRCYSWAYDVLQKQYDRAIRLLSEGGVGAQEANPNESLTDHLMILYWVGRLKLDDRPLLEFYDRASGDLSAHALKFIGRALKDSAVVPSEQLERLQNLWEKRLAVNIERGNQKNSKELAQFAVWFWSGKFDDKWALEQLIASMKASDDIEREFFVLERLLRLSASMSFKSLVALDLLVKSTHRKRDYFHGRDEAKVIIENGLRDADTLTQEKAREIADYLLSLRYSEFRELAK